MGDLPIDSSGNEYALHMEDIEDGGVSGDELESYECESDLSSTIWQLGEEKTLLPGVQGLDDPGTVTSWAISTGKHSK